MRLAPFGMMATASLKEIVRIVPSPTRHGVAMIDDYRVTAGLRI
jgi:hypothetical protein